MSKKNPRAKYYSRTRKRDAQLRKAIRKPGADVYATVIAAGLAAKYANLISDWVKEEAEKGVVNVSKPARKYGMGGSTGLRWAARLGFKSAQLEKQEKAEQSLSVDEPINLHALSRSTGLSLSAIQKRARRKGVKGMGRHERRPNPKTQAALEAISQNPDASNYAIAGEIDVDPSLVRKARLGLDDGSGAFTRRVQSQPVRQKNEEINSIRKRAEVLADLQKQDMTVKEVYVKHGWAEDSLSKMAWEYGIPQRKKKEPIDITLFLNAADELVRRYIRSATIAQIRPIMVNYCRSLSSEQFYEISSKYRLATSREEALSRVLEKLPEREVRALLTPDSMLVSSAIDKVPSLQSVSEARAKELIGFRLNRRPVLVGLEGSAIEATNRLSINEIRRVVEEASHFRNRSASIVNHGWMSRFRSIRPWPERRQFLDAALTETLIRTPYRTLAARRHKPKALSDVRQLESLIEGSPISLVGIPSGLYQALHFSLAAVGAVVNRTRIRRRIDQGIEFASNRNQLTTSAKGYVANPC